MKFKQVISTVLVGAMTVTMVGCGGNKTTSTNESNNDDTTSQSSSSDDNASTDSSADSSTDSSTDSSEAEEDLDYTYGEGVTFHSDTPVTYSMMYSDNEAYPYQEDWLLWQSITEKSNVSFDLNIIARADYDDKKSLLINAGESAYIIPKTYDESAFVTGGAIVPISDWVQYMPNYEAFVEKYNMQDDLAEITKADGKYYRLPGMWENPGGTGTDYTFVVRKDIFDAAGVDVTALEDDWTWDEFYDCLQKVADYTGKKNIWSDRWQGQALLQTIGSSYSVPSGWGAGDGMMYDSANDKFYFAEVTDDFKSFVTCLNQMVSSNILDTESFTQEDETALQKFYNGDTFVIGSSRSVLSVYETEMDKTLGAGNYELYEIVPPTGNNNYQASNSRLENGVMISQNALDELGEEGFIKMLRFVDWLWYSDEGKDLTKWGVEGTTYTKSSDGTYTLNSDISYGGINPDASKALNTDYGFGNGVFVYGGTYDQAVSMLSDDLKDYYSRIAEYRDIRPLNPTVAFDEDTTEMMNLIKTPLMDYVNTATLQFITGQLSIENDWDNYVATCAADNYEQYEAYYNNTYAESK